MNQDNNNNLNNLPENKDTFSTENETLNTSAENANTEDNNSMNDNTILNDSTLNNFAYSQEDNFSNTPLNTEPIKKERKRRNASNNASSGLKGKVIALVLAGVLCSSAGGAVGAYTTYSLLSNNQESTQKGNADTSADNKGDTFVANQTISNNNSSGSLSVAEIAQKVGPSVVGVSVKGFPKRTLYGQEMPSFEGIGSGVIFNEEGYILTNYHVVQDVVQSGGTVQVIFNNGQEVAAKVVNYDPSFDIAVVKITEDVTVPGVADFGDSDTLTQGETAVAIGNPLGAELLGSVSSGIISAIDRSLDEGDVKYIQTDAAISPGNSGGPLINSKGQVIGINTVKKVGQGVEGLGFAVPINQIKPLLENLMKPVLHIGITAIVVDQDLSAKANVPVGVYIKEVSEFSPAERSGMRPGDVIVEMDGKPVKSMDDINKIKESHKDGDTVPVVVDRNGQKVNLNLQLLALNP